MPISARGFTVNRPDAATRRLVPHRVLDDTPSTTKLSYVGKNDAFMDAIIGTIGEVKQATSNNAESHQNDGADSRETPAAGPAERTRAVRYDLGLGMNAPVGNANGGIVGNIMLSSGRQNRRAQDAAGFWMVPTPVSKPDSSDLSESTATTPITHGRGQPRNPRRDNEQVKAEYTTMENPGADDPSLLASLDASTTRGSRRPQESVSSVVVNGATYRQDGSLEDRIALGRRGAGAAEFDLNTVWVEMMKRDVISKHHAETGAFQVAPSYLAR